MKQLKIVFAIAVFSAILSITSCKKDACESCTVYLTNSDVYSYSIQMTDQPIFLLRSNETKEIDLQSSKTYTIVGSPNTYYAHNDFKSSVSCDGECGGIVVVVKN